MAIHSSILAWEIPWTEEPGGLQPMGSQRVRHDWAHVCMFIGGRIGFEVNWNRRKLQMQSLSYISRAQCPQVTSASTAQHCGGFNDPGASTTKGKKPMSEPLAIRPSGGNSRGDLIASWKSQGNHGPTSTLENSFICSYFGLCFFPHSLSPILGINSPVNNHAQVVVPGKQS